MISNKDNFTFDFFDKWSIQKKFKGLIIQRLSYSRACEDGRIYQKDRFVINIAILKSDILKGLFSD